MGHHDAKRRDARIVLSRGEIYTAVILDTEVDHRGSALTKIENIKTFVRPGDTSLDFADTAKIKIVDVGDSHSEAVALKKVH